MKKIIVLFALALIVTGSALASGPRYIFYFIGDGMGPNAITLTEACLSGKAGDKVGFVTLPFTSFPYVGYATTHCANRRVTDSAAAGTALATGQKTSVGTIGMDSSDIVPLRSIAYDAKSSGRRVGIASTVSIDHATPASFYAHQADRNMAYEISMEAPQAGFDFYAGSGFLDPMPKDKASLWAAFDAAGYKKIRSGAPITPSGSGPVLMLQPKGGSADALPLAIDARDEGLTLSEITRSAIDHLYNKKGFFVMIEGGQIDWAAHSNDAASLVGEVVDFSNAIDVAIEFYREHPSQTLIVITADHETGGLALGLGKLGYDTYFEMLQAQRCSQNMLERLVGETADWSAARAVIEREMGFGSQVPVTDAEWEAIERSYNKKAGSAAKAAVALLASKAGVSWSSGSHTGAAVPVYAIGHGAENFAGRMDNTDIAKRLRELIIGK